MISLVVWDKYMSCGPARSGLFRARCHYRRVTSADGGRPTARPPRAPEAERPAAWTAGRGRRRVFGSRLRGRRHGMAVGAR